MTVLKLKLPTDKEEKEQRDHLAFAYRELEPLICDVRRFTQLAFEKIDQADDMGVFLIDKVHEEVEKLFAEYYSAFNEPVFEKRQA